jgi:hypothetical protein
VSLDFSERIKMLKTLKLEGTEVGIYTGMDIPEVCISDPAFGFAKCRSAADVSEQPFNGS